MHVSADFYAGTLPLKLAIAQQLYENQAETILACSSLREGLANMRERESRLHVHMQAMWMSVHCIACAGKKGGGCCSAFMANENDVVQLLLNLLARVNVIVQRDDGYECQLLGPEGCILKYKPMFCLNYNCRQIMQAASPAQMEDLHKLAGSLLQEQYRVEQLVLGMLQRAGLFSR